MDTKRIKTLLVEDNSGDAFMVRKMFQTSGMHQIQLTHVVKLEQAIEKINQDKFAVVLLDLSLPDSQGLTTLLELQKQNEPPPIVVLTGTDDTELAVMALQEGAQDYLIKEKANAEVLDRAMRYAIERHRIEDKLRHRTQELEVANRQLEELNIQLGSTNQALEQRTTELEAANSELEAFSYTVSHDLRNPLTNIKGFTDLLNFQYFDQLDKSGQASLAGLQRNTNRMNQLIEDILHLSQTSRGQFCSTSVDLSAMVQEILAQRQQAQKSRQIEVVIAPALKVEGDSNLLRIALENLLGNAWKYTRKTEHARIEFGAIAQQLPNLMIADQANEAGKAQTYPQHQSHKQWVFFVRDNGVGFDMKDADQLFTPFKRLHKRAEFEGTGIGLSTAARIIHRHDGHIWAEAHLGKGASFFFTLPLAEEGLTND